MDREPKRTGRSEQWPKKIALLALLSVAWFFSYFTFLLGPLAKSRDEILNRIGEFEEKIAEGKQAIARAGLLEHQGEYAVRHSTEIAAQSPPGAPIAWFPTRLKALFAANGIEDIRARLLSSAPYPDAALKSWAKSTWIVEAPVADFRDVGRTLASLENEEALLTVTGVQIHATQNDPALQQIAIAVTRAVPQ